MSYIKRNLMTDEVIATEGSLHWFIYVPGLLFLLAGALTLFYLTGVEAAEPISIILFALGLFKLAASVLKQKTTELGVTSRRVFVKTGLIRRNTLELNHAKVECFAAHQGVFGSIFGFMTLTIRGTGSGTTAIHGISSPLDFRRATREATDRSQVL